MYSSYLECTTDVKPVEPMNFPSLKMELYEFYQLHCFISVFMCTLLLSSLAVIVIFHTK